MKMLLGLLLVGMTLVPSSAFAVCWFTAGSATTVTFNAGTITLTPSTQVNTVLWTSSTATPANPPTLRCNGSTDGGVVNTIAGQVAVNGDNTLFPTGIPGISYRLLHPDVSTKLRLYPNYPTTSGTFSVSTNLQLVYTGPYLPPSSSVLTGELARWKISICDNPNTFFGIYLGCNGTVGPRPVETFKINANIIIQVPTCDIDAGSVNKVVSLPPVGALQFTGISSTVAKTPYQLLLTNCPDGLDVIITLDTSTPQTGAVGVIAPTSGNDYAQGVGVQLLRGDGTTPVTFGSALSQGTTSGNNSTFTINQYARYYQTGGTVTAGLVEAVATYTINYQ